MAPCGTIAAYGSAVNMAPTLPFGPLLFKAITIDIALIYILPAPERAVAIDHIHRALAEGALTARVHKTYELEDTAKAHEAVEAAHRYGAILVKTA